jgi:acyl carrier protein
MDRAAVYEQIKDYIAVTFDVQRDLITPDAELADKLNLDSIDAIDLMARLQEITGRKVEPEDFKSVRTINDVLNLVQKHAQG